ncbi:hypothetical protein AB6E88_17470 [Providencia hangzhouensis]
MAWLMLTFFHFAVLATHRLIASLLACTIITAALTHVIDWQAVLYWFVLQ